MTMAKLFTGSPAPPSIAAFSYAGLLLVLIAATALPIKSVLDQRAAVNSLGNTLRLLDAHATAAARQDGGGDASMAGPAFLEGPTVTVAGAGLLQRPSHPGTRHGGAASASHRGPPGPPAPGGPPSP